MSAAWSILIIVFGGLAAVIAYIVIEGGEHLRGARQIIDEERDVARHWRDGE